MMEYIVVKEFNLSDFIKKVNELIQEGWKPQGGIFIHGMGAHYYYHQAMIRDVSKG